MSLNGIRPGPHSSLELTQGERKLAGPHEAEIEVRIPPTLEGPKRSLKSKGSIWVTDQRVVFLRSTGDQQSGSAQPPTYDTATLNDLESLVIPYSTLLSTKFELPIFSQNYITLSFLPNPLVDRTNLPLLGRGSDIKAWIWVGQGAGHGVWKVIEGERGVWVEKRDQGEVLPAYEE